MGFPSSRIHLWPPSQRQALHLAMRKGDSSALPVIHPLPCVMLPLRTTVISGDVILWGESLTTSLPVSYKWAERRLRSDSSKNPLFQLHQLFKLRIIGFDRQHRVSVFNSDDISFLFFSFSFILCFYVAEFNEHVVRSEKYNWNDLTFAQFKATKRIDVLILQM